jgi:hypothetical protein
MAKSTPLITSENVMTFSPDVVFKDIYHRLENANQRLGSLLLADARIVRNIDETTTAIRKEMTASFKEVNGKLDTVLESLAATNHEVKSRD